MKTIIYKKLNKLAGMASTYDYIVKYPKSVIEVKTLDYMVPYQNATLILNNERLHVSGSLFDIDDQILKILID